MKNKAAMAVAILLAAGASCSAGNVRFGDTPAARIAKDASIPGKGKTGGCLPFALALEKKFEAAGIAARVIVYGYETGGVPAVSVEGDLAAQPTGATRGSHAVVVYEDGGRTYMMDNQSWTPRWIHSASPVQMAQQFSGINCSVKMARVIDGADGSPKSPVLMSSARQIAAN